MAQILFNIEKHEVEDLTEEQRDVTLNAVHIYRCGRVRGFVFEVQEDGYFATRENPSGRGWGGGKWVGKWGLLLVPGEKADLQYIQSSRCYDSFVVRVLNAFNSPTDKLVQGNDIRNRYLIDVSKLPAPDIWTGKTAGGIAFERHIFTASKVELVDRDTGYIMPETGKEASLVG